MVHLQTLFKNPIFLLKCAQMAMTIFSISAVQDIGTASIITMSNLKRNFVYTVTGGYAFIILWQIGGIVMGKRTTKKVALLWAGNGAALWLIAGWMMLQTYNNFFPYGTYLDVAAGLIPGGKIISAGILYAVESVKDRFFIAGVITVVNGCTFLAEAWTINKRKESKIPSLRSISNWIEDKREITRKILD